MKRIGLGKASQEQLYVAIGNAVASCYGAAGMANSNARQGLRTLPRRRDVRFHRDGNGLAVDLRILAIHDLNISAVVRGVTAKVRHTVKEAAGLEISMVNIFVDEIIGGE